MKKNILYCRITTSISEKVNFYFRHLKKGDIDQNSPYIIFLGLGALAREIFSGDFGIEYTSILYGKGNPTLSINSNAGRISHIGYTHNNELINHNGAKINCNIYATDEYRHISGIMISDADLDDEYTTENTWLFINPNADIKINPIDFPHVVYWDLYDKSVYGPYRNKEKIADS